MLIANRKCHAGLLAMLEKEDVKVNLSKLLAWRQRQEDWRHLRHKRAIREFHEELRSKAYTNPPQRRELFARIRQGLEGRHEERIGMLRGLGAMLSPNLKLSLIHI